MIQRSKEIELEAIKKLRPSERLMIATELSDICIKLMKAGKEAMKNVHGKKP
jgi:hypothetical protein